MQEFILILVVIFVLFKIFGRPTVIHYQQHHHTHHNSGDKIKVHTNKPPKNKANDEGEYVDYEEIK
jgi:hypothetical protein